MTKPTLEYFISSLISGEVIELLSASLEGFNDLAYLCHFCTGPNQTPAGDVKSVSVNS